MSASVSGLSPEHRQHARNLIVRQAQVMVANKGVIRYSQEPDRMVGIRNKLTIIKGEFPHTCDCSSTVYWMLWDAMHRPYGVRDLVAHNNWITSYTGSQYKNGKAVIHDTNLKIGDVIFYGDQGGGVPEHEAIYVGGGKVFSHGSSSGPYILDLDYRKDRRMSRRYI